MMFHILKTVDIKPKDGVEEKLSLDVNQNKKWNIFFGILEFSNVYTLGKLLWRFFSSLCSVSELFEQDLPFIVKISPFVEILLILSIFATGVLFFCNKKVAYNIYYVQFFLRLIFFVPSFGVLFMIEYILSNQILHGILAAVCVVLEIARLILTFFILRQSKRYV